MEGGEGRPKTRIVDVTLDEHSVVRWSPEVEHERNVAIYDLLEENEFAPVDDERGPYTVRLSIEENRLVFDIRCAEDGAEVRRIALPLTGFRSIIRDYFTVCGSYYDAIKHASPRQIEALDMGRRGLHDEGSTLLRDRLADRVGLDFNTARRLFTLICVLHIRG